MRFLGITRPEWSLFVILFGMTLALGAAPAWGLDTPEHRVSLKGLKAVRVVIEDVGSKAQAAGLTAAQLHTDVEARLRQAGVQVDPKTPGYLYVSVMMDGGEPGPYAVSIQVEYKQGVLLRRDPETQCIAGTWSVGEIAILDSDHLQEVQTRVADYVHRFIAAFREQNPGPEAAPAQGQ